jgi:DNA-binding LytR/AlgR family response regulator
MRLRLICSPERRELLTNLLESRGLGPDPEAELAISQRGMDPGESAALVFDPDHPDALIPFLDALSSRCQDPVTSVAVRRENRIELVPIRQILYFETLGAGVRCYTASGAGDVRERLYELEVRLPAARFIRVSKSALANLGAVREVHPWFGRRLLLRFGVPDRQVEVSKNYVRILKDRLGL